MAKKTALANLPTSHGDFKIHIYTSEDGLEHVALQKGEIHNPSLLRIHSSCLTGDIFSSLRCDCGDQLTMSLELIQENNSGILLYLNQEGRGIGLTNKIRAYALQEKGYDTVEANKLLHLPIDARDYKVAADILKDFGISQVNVLTNNPDKTQQLEQYGIKILKRVPIEIKPNPNNHDYLKTKKEKMSHILSLV